MLAIENLTKRYGSVAALQSVSLSLERGEFFGLLGPNGAGKTTLMSLVAGIRPADSGEIRLNGAPLDHRRVEQRAQLGFVPQSLALYDELSGEENMRLPVPHTGYPSSLEPGGASAAPVAFVTPSANLAAASAVITRKADRITVDGGVADAT